MFFGKFDDKIKKGNLFKINGRKIDLMPYEYIQRNIPIGKNGSIEINYARYQLVGGEEGGEVFFNASKSPFFSSQNTLNFRSNFGVSGILNSIPLNAKNEKNAKTTKSKNRVSRNFSYFLYNIYNEKIVIARTRDGIIAAKEKELAEKRKAKEA